MTDAVFALEGVERRYAWGSPTAVPELLGREPDGEPIAELWFGAHEDGPALVVTDGRRLDALVAEDPAGLLGADVAQRFAGRLPFLLKVLAAASPLSIQVHPDLAQARRGFAAEDARGVPRDAPQRNYRDANHKPELLCALTPFDALCGFRPVARTLDTLAVFALPELDPVAAALRGPDPLRTAFTALLSAEDPAPLARSVARRAVELVDDPIAGGSARAVGLAAAAFEGDVGVPLALLLNPVRLAPGEAIFLAAGNVHAYLQGTGVEIMANSDNVLRCGLTPKHVDVAELLAITDFRELDEPRWDGQPWGDCREFTVPVEDFALLRISLDDYRKPGRASGQCAVSVGPWLPYVVLCVSGSVTVAAAGTQVALTPGRAAFVAAREEAFTLTGTGLSFVATVGGQT